MDDMPGMPMEDHSAGGDMPAHNHSMEDGHPTAEERAACPVCSKPAEGEMAPPAA